MDIIAILRGLVLNPLLVAFARGLAEAVALAAIFVAIEFFSGPVENIPDWLQSVAPLIVLGLRQAEGLADRIDPAKARRRDALRDAAVEAGDPSTALQAGDVKDKTAAEMGAPGAA